MRQGKNEPVPGPPGREGEKNPRLLAFLVLLALFSGICGVLSGKMAGAAVDMLAALIGRLDGGQLTVDSGQLLVVVVRLPAAGGGPGRGSGPFSKKFGPLAPWSGFWRILPRKDEGIVGARVGAKVEASEWSLAPGYWRYLAP